jgi:hypothetical protein
MAMPKKPDDIFKGDMAGWEPVQSPATHADDSSDRPLSAPDRVARERPVLIEKYLGDANPPANEANPSKPRNPRDDDQHATLQRMKKKNALDTDVNAKTFVITDGKIVGSQG